MQKSSSIWKYENPSIYTYEYLEFYKDNGRACWPFRKDRVNNAGPVSAFWLPVILELCPKRRYIFCKWNTLITPQVIFLFESFAECCLSDLSLMQALWEHCWQGHQLLLYMYIRGVTLSFTLPPFHIDTLYLLSVEYFLSWFTTHLSIKQWLSWHKAEDLVTLSWTSSKKLQPWWECVICLY